MLHVTNGSAAADRIRAAGVPGTVFPWDEVLHEGPVPGGLRVEELRRVRAAFIAGRGWGTRAAVEERFARQAAVLERARNEDEVVLWFEHDLFDQLQLLQLLDHFAEAPARRLTLVNPPEYLGGARPPRLAELFRSRCPVTAAQLAQGRRAWGAFRAPTPERMEELALRGVPELPFVAGAFCRLLEQLPGAEDGASRSERQVLEALAVGARTAGELFELHNALEDPVWLGDSTFLGYLEEMARPPHPLIERGAEDTPWPGRTCRLTRDGEAVAAGRVDAVWLRGIDRWVGGTHLQGGGPVWRWDRVAGRVVER